MTKCVSYMRFNVTGGQSLAESTSRNTTDRVSGPKSRGLSIAYARGLMPIGEGSNMHPADRLLESQAQA